MIQLTNVYDKYIDRQKLTDKKTRLSILFLPPLKCGRKNNRSKTVQTNFNILLEMQSFKTNFISMLSDISRARKPIFVDNSH